MLPLIAAAAGTYLLLRKKRGLGDLGRVQHSWTHHFPGDGTRRRTRRKAKSVRRRSRRASTARRGCRWVTFYKGTKRERRVRFCKTARRSKGRKDPRRVAMAKRMLDPRTGLFRSLKGRRGGRRGRRGRAVTRTVRSRSRRSTGIIVPPSYNEPRFRMSFAGVGKRRRRRSRRR